MGQKQISEHMESTDIVFNLRGSTGARVRHVVGGDDEDDDDGGADEDRVWIELW